MVVKPLPIPPSPEADAKSRAWRTLFQSLLVDVAAAVVLAVTPLLAQVQWTKGYWGLILALASRSAVTAVVAWVMRKVLPPKP